MKKSDLKTGMTVTTENGSDYLVLIMDGEMILANVKGKSAICGDSVGEDLTVVRDLNIMKVYMRNGITLNDLMFTHGRKLLWERKKAKEMTLSEIEEQLGYPVKIIE